MPKAALFDLDGTLADTIGDIARSVNTSLAARGYPVHATKAYKLMVGNGFRNLVKVALPESARMEAIIGEVHAEASAAYEAGMLVETRPYTGVVEALAWLKSKGIPMAVLSNKPEPLVIRMVEALFPKAGFLFVRGESAAFPRKPAPDQALELSRLIGVMAEEIAYIGDSDVDMIMARNAGMVAIGAGWGFRGSAELQAAGAERILEKPLDILTLFDK